MSLLLARVLLPAATSTGRRRHVSLKRGSSTSTTAGSSASATSSRGLRGRRLDGGAVSAPSSSSSSCSCMTRRMVRAGAVTRSSSDVAVSARRSDDPEEQMDVDTEEETAVACGTNPELLVLCAVLTNAMYDTAAYAYDGYSGIGVPDDEATPLQNAFGLVFTVFCGWYFLRVVKKRGNRAKEFRVANSLPVRQRTKKKNLYSILHHENTEASHKKNKKTKLHSILFPPTSGTSVPFLSQNCFVFSSSPSPTVHLSLTVTTTSQNAA